MRRKRDVHITPEELAEQIGAELRNPPREAQVPLHGLAPLESAGPADLTFVAGRSNLPLAFQSRAGAFLAESDAVVEGRPTIVVRNVWSAVLEVLDLWHPDEPPAPGVDASAVVSAEATIAEDVSVGPLAVVEAGARIGRGAQIGAQCFIGRDAVVGAESLLHPGVRVLERVRLGERVILHSGVVLGADGFGYQVLEGRGVKIPQVGTVVVEDDVEIGANSCVDRAFLTDTRIGAGTKMDNLVHVAHNCRIGRHCGLAAQVGVAGSTRIGDGCVFWGQAGVADHARIGDRVEIGAQAGVRGDVEAGSHLFGTPAIPMKEAARLIAVQKRVPDMLKRVRDLEKRLEEE